jgi:hypothetical protein
MNRTNVQASHVASDRVSTMRSTKLSEPLAVRLCHASPANEGVHEASERPFALDGNAVTRTDLGEVIPYSKMLHSAIVPEGH